MCVKHTRHTVKAESIKLILLHIETQVAQKETQNFIAAIVKQPRVPKLMASLLALVEIEVICAVKLVETVLDILAGVRVDNVQEHLDAHSVGSVNELHQVLWRTITTRHGEKVGDLVSKGRIVGVLLDGHELDGIVSELLDAREDIGGKLLKLTHAGLGRADADMGFVQADRLGLWWSRILELVLLWWVPEDGIVDGANGEVLDDSLDPGRETVDALTAWLQHRNLVSLDTLERTGSIARTLILELWGMAGRPLMAGTTVSQTP